MRLAAGALFTINTFIMVRRFTNFFSILVLLPLVAGVSALQGCALLSRGQMKAVESFTASGDSLSRYPGGFFEEMAGLRAARGLYFSASLSDGALRVEEINAIYAGKMKDLQLAKKANLSWEILGKYQNALRVLAGAARWQDAGREFRSLGRSVDSLVKEFNSLEIADAVLPMGIGKAAGRLVGYSSQLLIRRAQTRAVKGFVKEGDTLVSAVVASLVQVLKSPAVTALIENEKQGLEQNYISYLKSYGAANSNLSRSPLAYNDDKEYLALKERVEKLTYIRGGIISAANRMAKAHKKIAEEFTKKRKVDELYRELQDFEKEVKTLRKEIFAITKNWPY